LIIIVKYVYSSLSLILLRKIPRSHLLFPSNRQHSKITVHKFKIMVFWLNLKYINKLETLITKFKNNILLEHQCRLFAKYCWTKQLQCVEIVIFSKAVTFLFSNVLQKSYIILCESIFVFKFNNKCSNIKFNPNTI